jgi:uncharacterized membrane protein YkoI
MKTKFIVATALFGITAFAGLGLVYADEEASENEQKIAITEMPTTVQKTIQDNLAGGTVTETAKETKEGRTYYEAKIQKSGGEEIEIKVDPDGKLITAGKEEENGEKGEEDND